MELVTYLTRHLLEQVTEGNETAAEALSWWDHAHKKDYWEGWEECCEMIQNKMARLNLQELEDTIIAATLQDLHTEVRTLRSVVNSLRMSAARGILTPDVRADIARRFADTRKEAGLTAADAAEMLHISTGILGMLESGKSVPSKTQTSLMEAWLEAYGQEEVTV